MTGRLPSPVTLCSALNAKTDMSRRSKSKRSVPIQEIYSVTGETKTWVLDHLGDTMKFLSKLRTYIQLVGEIEFDATRTILYLEPETPQEEELSLPSGPIELVISGRPEKTPIFNFQVFTAILWKCQGDVPTHLRFMGELKAMGRRSYRQGRFLDSFRFNFLLVDSLYGQGQFKTKAFDRSIVFLREICHRARPSPDEFEVFHIKC